MMLEDLLEQYPKTALLKDGRAVILRPLQPTDERAFHQFFCEIPETERLLFKHRVTDPEVIRDWCQNVNYHRILPLLALDETRILADASLHQSLGGWKRHIGRISVVVHPAARGLGLAKTMVRELIEVAQNIGLEHLEAEFMGEQLAARHVFGKLGFTELLVLKDYVKDMQAIPHDYVLMGRRLITDEEFAAAN
ncbi:MAG: GNAT family N-acetyltransferase [Verrucomicrobiae bacterium]|nr:GNAT family N-acetyltransferase [Verrucomicrobiae bacterium]